MLPRLPLPDPSGAPQEHLSLLEAEAQRAREQLASAQSEAAARAAEQVQRLRGAMEEAVARAKEQAQHEISLSKARADAAADAAKLKARKKPHSHRVVRSQLRLTEMIRAATFRPTSQADSELQQQRTRAEAEFMRAAADADAEKRHLADQIASVVRAECSALPCPRSAGFCV